MPSVPFRVRALYDYSSEYDDDLNFAADTVITVTSVEDAEWYSGKYTDPATGELCSGIFPQNFVETLSEPAVPASRPKRLAMPAEDTPETPSINEKEDHEVQQGKTEEPLTDSGLVAASAHESAPASKDLKGDSSLQDTPPTTAASTGQEPKEVEKQPEVKEASQEPKLAQPPKAKNAFFNKIAAFNTQGAAPILPGNKPKEEAHIKKSFYGTGPSSYVPSGFGNKKKSQVPPPPSAAAASAQAPVAATTSSLSESQEPAKKSKSEEAAQPKLSLKERIALLQKRQQEEAEREAALLKKKSEKKKKKSPPAPPSAGSAADATLEDAPPPIPQGAASQSKESLTRTPTMIDGENIRAESTKEPEVLTQTPPIPTLAVDVEEEAGPELEAHAEEVGPVDEVEQEPLMAENQQKVLEEAEQEDQDEGEENEEDEEDEEEARKRALRERMAKLSGGAGMFGMMGVNPFAPAPQKKKAKSKAEEDEQKEVEQEKGDAEDDDEEKETPRAVPILPVFGSNPPNLPGFPAPKRASAQESSSEVSSNVSDIKDDIDNETFESLSDKKDIDEMVQNADNTPKLAGEDKAIEIPTVSDGGLLEDSIGEEEGEAQEEQPLCITSEQAEQVNPLVSSNPAASIPTKPLTSASTAETLPDQLKPQQQVDIDKKGIVSDGETTGYEGDDDTEAPIQHNEASDEDDQVGEIPPARSHRGSNDATDSHSKLKGLPIDQVASAGPSPLSRPLQVPPPLPAASNAPPPITSSVPPSIPPTPASPAATPVAPSGVPSPLPTTSAPTQDIKSASTAPAFPSSIPPPVPGSQAPPIPGSISKSQTLPEEGQFLRNDQFNNNNTSIRRNSSLFNKRQSVDSGYGGRASIDSYRSSGGYAVPTDTVERSLTNHTHTSNYAIPVAQDIDVYESGDWYLRDELPPSLHAQNNESLIYQVEQTKLQKRGGLVTITVKDFYIIFASQDSYVQKLVSASFDESQPENVTFQIIDYPTAAASQSTTNDNLGLELYRLASKYNGHSVDPEQGFVIRLYSKLPAILPPIGSAFFGRTIYINESQRNVSQTDDFQPGDVLRINNAKFSGHNRLHQKIVYEVGVKEPLVAVISEFDAVKRKFRVLEKDSKSKVKPVSYKVSDLISGTIKVFRPVSRELFCW